MKFGGILIKLLSTGTNFWKKNPVYLSQLLTQFLTKLLFLVLYYYTSIHLLLGSQSKVQVVATAHSFKEDFFLAFLKGEKVCFKGKKTVRGECQL